MSNAPKNLQDIVERIKTAESAGTPLRIRGGGTKDFYGQLLQGEILDTTGLNGITSYEPSELVVTVQAGTPLAELEAVLAEKNQCLPFEPPHYGLTLSGADILSPFAQSQTTVGGMVAAGLSGPSRASSGSVKDFVLGVNMVNGKGEELHFGGTVMKNVAGYDVSRLLAGSMGTLGLMTEVSLKVLPIAPAEATLKFECSQSEAINMLNTWGAQPLPLNASCWIREAGVGSLYVRLRGAVAAVDAAVKKMGGTLQTASTGNTTVAADWQALRNQSMNFFKLQGDECLWRLSVPDTAPDLHLGDTLVEWHGAQRWVKLPYSDASIIRGKVNALGGNAILFVAAQAMNTPNSIENKVENKVVFNPLKAALDRIHRDLKRQFDPAGIFNRGRMFADM
ncbi:MAG: glycolate oxidase subunit GlcE [Pseudomonadota bacterium]